MLCVEDVLTKLKKTLIKYNPPFEDVMNKIPPSNVQLMSEYLLIEASDLKIALPNSYAKVEDLEDYRILRKINFICDTLLGVEEEEELPQHVRDYIERGGEISLEPLEEEEELFRHARDYIERGEEISLEPLEEDKQVESLTGRLEELGSHVFDDVPDLEQIRHNCLLIESVKKDLKEIVVSPGGNFKKVLNSLEKFIEFCHMDDVIF